MDLFRLDGMTAAVTGASSGFGHHFAGVLAEAGAHVVLGARRVDKIEARVEEIRQAGGSAEAVALDVNDRASLEAYLDRGFAARDGLDVLVNNAGVEAGAKTYTMIDEADWDNVMDTNVKSTWLATKLYTERVLERKQAEGNVVNIASITAFRTIKGQFPYAVSKAALVQATKVMALEGAKFGIRVNALAPGYVHTDVSKVLLDSARSETFVKGIPMRRYGEFEDMDGPLLLLASKASRYMTGSVVVVDGGHICAELPG